MALHLLATVAKDIGQRIAIARVSDSEAAHGTANDDSEKASPFLWILHPHVLPKGTNGWPAMPMLLPDLLHHPIHPVPVYRELALLNLAALTNLLLALDDSGPKLTLFLLQARALLPGGVSFRHKSLTFLGKFPELLLIGG